MPRPLNVEFEKLKTSLHSMSTRVEENYIRSARAVTELDGSLAETVIEKEAEIDALEVEIEKNCTELLARYQPLAKDLRFIIAVIKINNDLERIGDLSKNIAKRALELSRMDFEPTAIRIKEPAAEVRSMLSGSITALIEKSAEKAYEIIDQDDLVDAIHRENFAIAEELLASGKGPVAQVIRLLSVSRNLERIGDLATNIAEEVIFVNEGAVVRHRSAFDDKSDGNTSRPTPSEIN